MGYVFLMSSYHTLFSCAGPENCIQSLRNMLYRTKSCSLFFRGGFAALHPRPALLPQHLSPELRLPVHVSVFHWAGSPLRAGPMSRFFLKWWQQSAWWIFVERNECFPKIFVYIFWTFGLLFLWNWILEMSLWVNVCIFWILIDVARLLKKKKPKATFSHILFLPYSQWNQ